ncbi:MAG: DedA family protein [Alphaproteobacteria bacterium]|nr:DedA family protein [Alphaproteobacteria bacterium]
MNEILQLIQQHGTFFYVVTFIWAALEGETFVIFAGLAAQRGLLNLYILWFAAGAGSMAGDQFMFVIGRFYGRRVVRRFPKIEPKLKKILGTLEKYSTSFILTYRFMYGVRNISALAIGMSNLSWRRFASLNAAASFLWSAAFCGAGYGFGVLIGRLSPGDDEAIEMEVRSFMIAILALVILIAAARVMVARAKARKEEREEAQNIPVTPPPACPKTQKNPLNPSELTPPPTEGEK